MRWGLVIFVGLVAVELNKHLNRLNKVCQQCVSTNCLLNESDHPISHHLLVEQIMGTMFEQQLEQQHLELACALKPVQFVIFRLH